MMHWAAQRRRRVASKRSPPGSASTADLVHSRASPAASDSGEDGSGGGGRGEGPPAKLAGATQPHLRCSSCAAIDAARSAAAELGGSSNEEKELDVEMGRIVAASVDPLRAGAPPDSAAPPRCCARRQPCCAGNPDCCGPTARCYNTGAGPAAAEILPGTEAAEVVAVLQSDPHTKDLLRMGECMWALVSARAGAGGIGSMHSKRAAAAGALCRRHGPAVQRWPCMPCRPPALRASGLISAAGIFTGLAIALHNLPEGLATFVGALNDTKVCPF